MSEQNSTGRGPRTEMENHAGYSVIFLNRPEKYNPLDTATLDEIAAALRQIEEDPAQRAVILSGRGKAFSAGGDLSGYLELYRDSTGFQRFLDRFSQVCTAIERSEKIVIAAVNGFAVAGGLELMLACDLVFAAETARIGDGHVNYGQIPGAGGSQRLPRAIGALRAKSLMFSGDLLTAKEALAIGLVTKVVPDGELLTSAKTEANRLSARSPACLAGMKMLINQGLDMPLADGLKMERQHVHRYATAHPDAMEGLVAFRDKRTPRFR